MSDQHLLSDMVEALFAELSDAAHGAEAWGVFERVSLPSLLLAEDEGGFGGSWDDARIVFRAAGYFALAAPLPEAVLAAYVAKRAGASGRGALAGSTRGDFTSDTFSGEAHGAIESEGASYIVSPDGAGGAFVVFTEGGERFGRAAMSGLSRDTWRFDKARAARVDADIFALGAFARACQIAGALDAALAKSVAYANDRTQFGRPLGQFQAVQQNLATFACEAAAANCAAAGAAQALDAGGAAAFEIAAAKLRANRAVGVGASVAHQVHGAIGFTRDYSLHPLTRRLWAWRSEFGGDDYWAKMLGDRVLSSGADAVWASVSEPGRLS